MQYSQRVEGAQTLEGIWSQLWYLVVTQVSVRNRAKKERGRAEAERHRTTDRVSKGARNAENTDRETQRSIQATNRIGLDVFVDGWRGAQYVYLLIYSHPAQLLIGRKCPSWDHLDGVLLQSSGTKHTHRPLRSDINIHLSQSYLCCITDCSFLGALANRNISR